MPQKDLGSVVGPAGPQGAPGKDGLPGPAGPQGASATINGKQTINIIGGSGILLSQEDTDLTISTTVHGKNLLDNWYFADPINQRGQAKYITTDGTPLYTIDRWCTARSQVTQDDSGVSFVWNGTLGERGYFQQIIEFDNLVGETVTFSAIVDGELITLTAAIPDSNVDFPEKKFFNGSFSIAVNFSDHPHILFFSYDTTPHTIKAAKLELGSMQTLAHQENGKWVLNDPPPNKALELVKCQRYYEESINKYTITKGIMIIPYKVTKRAAATITIKDVSPSSMSESISVVHGGQSSCRLDFSGSQADFNWIANADL